MNRPWTSSSLLELARTYQPSCALAAAAELEVFDALTRRPLTAGQAARQLRCDRRSLEILLDALTALGLLRKRGLRYRTPAHLTTVLSATGSHSLVPMLQHQANCLRRWAQLAGCVKTGRPAVRTPSVRGARGDTASFIGAMHVINADVADEVIRAIRPLSFRCVLDVGGGSGTWTLAFLRARPLASAILFDLPGVISLARKRLTAAGMGRRVRLVAGDFCRDSLPSGADLAWVSAIVHQNSREQNRRLFCKVHRALAAGGRIAIRDIVMEKSRTAPISGALFAINMLVATEGGGTFTFQELREDLRYAGFHDVRLARREEGMNSVVVAVKSCRD